MSETPFSYISETEQRRMIEAVAARHEIVFGQFRQPVPERYYTPEPHEGRVVRVYSDIPARDGGFMTATVQHIRQHATGKGRERHIWPASWSICITWTPHAMGRGGWDTSLSIPKASCPTVKAMRERVTHLIASSALHIGVVPFPWEPDPALIWNPENDPIWQAAYGTATAAAPAD